MVPWDLGLNPNIQTHPHLSGTEPLSPRVWTGSCTLERPDGSFSPLLWLPDRILVCCAWHEEAISPQMRAKKNPPTSFSPLPVRVQAITRTTKAHRVHSWRLTIHTYCVALSEILHPSGQGAIFHGTVMSQWLCLELHTVSRAKKKKGAISLAVIIGLAKKFVRIFPCHFMRNPNQLFGQ